MFQGSEEPINVLWGENASLPLDERWDNPRAISVSAKGFR